MKNKVISILLLICMCVCFSMTSYATMANYAVSGRGTASNPFRITDADELMLLADFPECYFELENDIEFTGTWEPVADFSGSLDGKGHTITVSDYMAKTNMGLFGNLSGSVKNLTIYANNMEEERGSETYIGLFAGKCSGTIENCRATGTFAVKRADGKSSYGIKMGGFCGELSGTIRESGAQFDLFKPEGWSYSISAGGICGYLAGSVEQCFNMSKVYCYDTCYAGIASTVSQDAWVKDSMNLEAATTLSASGYAGIAYSNSGKIEHCYSVGGNYATSYYRYGIAPGSGGTMTNCYYDKVVLGNSNTSYGIPKSTLAMKMEMTYQDWDFENVWAIDESEENPINNGYPYLKVFYTEVVQPITVSTLSAVNGKLVIDTKITDVSEDYTLHIAFYGDNNRLCGYIAIPNERQLKDVFVVCDDIEDAKFAKIFTWYSSDAMEPVAACETVEIQR